MKRREFLEKTGCACAGLAAVPLGVGPLAAGTGSAGEQSRPRYAFEIEIYEAREDTWCHHKGDKFKYPDEWGKVCPWLRTSMNDFLRVLENGGTLRWTYEGTPYEKVIDPDGVTTEFVRCPDPTANLVAKITRTKVG